MKKTKIQRLVHNFQCVCLILQIQVGSFEEKSGLIARLNLTFISSILRKMFSVGLQLYSVFYFGNSSC
ncbi:hypothetical protein Csa_004930 [Cucumis sativus]|uniref:Uncharacterized protein n=1 Tax=Cucumis sativus TaxID=3659 RepID=A0A0A0KAE6_CUCSA|nr:hypothetical protein Csa_004930 [Cucumis sativus]